LRCKEPRAPGESVIKKTTRTTNHDDYTLGRAKGTVISSLKRKIFVDALEESSRRKYNALKQLAPKHEFVQRIHKFMENRSRTVQRSKNSEITDHTRKAHEDAQAAAFNNAGGARQDGHHYVAAWKTAAELPDDVVASKLLREYRAYTNGPSRSSESNTFR